MKNRSAQRLIALGVAAAVAVSLAACSGGAGGSSSSNRPEGEIHVLVLGDAAAKAEKAAATRFNKTSKVKVVIDTGSTAGGEYNTTLRSQIGTSKGPDIFMSWGAAGIDPLVKAGGLMDLDSFIKEQPKLKSSFLPSVFNEEVIDGKTYGIPMRGVSPEFLYYNKSVLDAAGLKPATTWDDLMSQVNTLKGQGVTPIGLAGADKWPQQIWFQYMYARLVGNDEVAKGLKGDSKVWESSESKKALSDIRSLIDSGAFGPNFQSVTYGGDGSAGLLRTGKSAYGLMGSWHYATVGDSANLGWTAFPSISGGEGQKGEIVGNLSNYYNVAANTRYPDTARDFLEELYSTDFLKDQLSLGNAPPTENASTLINDDSSLDAPTKSHLDFVVNLVKNAPTFQLSWDQSVPASQQTASQDAAADFFSGALDSDGFIKQMVTITSASK